MDLSLEFPDRYQFTSLNARIAQDICHVTGEFKGQHRVNFTSNLKEELDTSILWRTFFWNKQWKFLFRYRFYLYYIW